jgi:hypothetical protein
VVGYQHFRGPCYLHLQGEVIRLEKSGIDLGLDWRGAIGAASQSEVWSDLAAITTSLRRAS